MPFIYLNALHCPSKQFLWSYSVFLFHLLPKVQLIQKNCQPANVVSILLMMPEVVLIYDFILFPFYLSFLIGKSPFPFIGQHLATRLICLDMGLWWPFYWFWWSDLSLWMENGCFRSRVITIDRANIGREDKVNSDAYIKLIDSSW